MNKDINTLTREQKIAQSYFPAAFIHESDEHIRDIERLIVNQQIGGLTFFHSKASAAANYDRKTEFKKLESTLSRLQELVHHYQSLSKIPLLMCMDAEWGLAMRIENTPLYPFAISLGAIQEDSEKLIYEVGKQTAQDLKAVGIHLNLAPVADINDNPMNPVIGYRSFSADKKKVSKYAMAYYKGLIKGGVEGCYKHFPGHGNTSVDSHLGLPILLQSKEELENNELVPFIDAIWNGVGIIMIGHLAVPALTEGQLVPATLSKEIINGYLQQELGFKGLVMSDAMNMKSISNIYERKGELDWRAYDAGIDMICYSDYVEEGLSIIAESASHERVDMTFNKIIKLKQKLGLFDQLTSLPLYAEKADRLNSILAPKIITKIREKDQLKTLKNAYSRGRLLKVNVYGEQDTVFFERVGDTFGGEVYNVRSQDDLVGLRERAGYCDTLLVAIFPPSMRPSLEFGMDRDLVSELSKLFTEKNTVLYFFGTPFAMKSIPHLSLIPNITLCYQEERSFQIAASRNLLNNDQVSGSLPVPLEDVLA